MTAEIQNKQNIIHEAVAVFHDADSLQGAIDELQEHGFMRQEISVLADAGTVEKKLGHVYRRVEEARDDPDAPRTVFLSNETLGEAEGTVIGLPLYIAAATAAGTTVMSGGTLFAAALAATAAGVAGASIGTALAVLISRQHADHIESQIEQGGLLLWVHLRQPGQEKTAMEILCKHNGDNIHIHEIAL